MSDEYRNRALALVRQLRKKREQWLSDVHGAALFRIHELIRAETERDELKKKRVNLLRFLTEDVAELFDDVWGQFAVPGTVKGVTKLWAGGLSTLEAVEAMRETLASMKEGYADVIAGKEQE